MDLDELKNTWNLLDERLKSTQSLNNKIVKDMLETKGNRALSKLSNFEWFGLVVVIFVTPLPLLVAFKQNLSVILMVILAIFSILLLYSVGSQIWKIRTLAKIDFVNSVSSNISLLERFNIHIKREKMQIYFVFPLIAFFLFESFRSLPNVSMERIIFSIIVIIIGVVMCFWQYKKVYDANISSIMNSLQELRDLEED